MAGKILKSKRLWMLIGGGILVLILVFDRHSFIGRQELKKDIKMLQNQRDYYLERIREDSMVIEKLRDNDYLEQYAREHFLMKRDSDIVYVLEQ